MPILKCESCKKTIDIQYPKQYREMNGKLYDIACAEKEEKKNKVNIVYDENDNICIKTDDGRLIIVDDEMIQMLQQSQ
jgi:hypothetical protein